MSSNHESPKNSDVERLLESGAEHALGRRCSEAIQEFTRVIQAVPDFAEGYYARGLVYLEQGDLDQALEDCSRAVRLKPEHPWTLEGDGLYLGRPWKYYMTSGHPESLAGMFEWDRWRASYRRLPEPARPEPFTYGCPVCHRTEDGKVVYGPGIQAPRELFKPAPREDVLGARIRVMGEDSADGFEYCVDKNGYPPSGIVPESLVTDLRLTYEHTLLLTYYWPDWEGQIQAPAAEVALCRLGNLSQVETLLDELVRFGWLALVPNPQFSAPVYEPARAMTETLWPHLKPQWRSFVSRHGRMHPILLRASGSKGGFAIPRAMWINVGGPPSET